VSRPHAAELRGASKVYPRGLSAVVALDDVSLTVEAGESVAVMGPSGSGKSTLLSLLGCLDRPSTGECYIGGEAVRSQDDAALSRLRNRSVGFVFQSFHLIPELTVLENVEMPLAYGPVPPGEWQRRALAQLDRVGLRQRADHRPTELSGGEAQRVAIARALVTQPALVLADEPTGNLDTRTGEEIASLLFGMQEQGGTLVLVTHDAALASRAQRVVRLRDGRLQTSAAPASGQDA
jgi:putative ABC transport system ATP-binding protein